MKLFTPGIFEGAHAQRDESTGRVRFINILTWLRDFRVKIVNFLSFLCLSIPKGDSNTKKTTPNIEVWPESPGAMLEYWYIERGLLHGKLRHANIYVQNLRVLTRFFFLVKVGVLDVWI